MRAHGAEAAAAGEGESGGGGGGGGRVAVHLAAAQGGAATRLELPPEGELAPLDEGGRRMQGGDGGDGARGHSSSEGGGYSIPRGETEEEKEEAE